MKQKKEERKARTESDNAFSTQKTNILVAYFSHSGNTRAVANQICESVGGDIFEIEPENLYPTNYNAAVKQAKQELESGYKPKLKTKVEDMELYNVVFVGYPIWWSTIPRPVVTFLLEYDFSGKTIIPFCTHDGSYLGRSVEDIKKLCPQSTVQDGLEVWGKDVKNAQNKVFKWLRQLEMTK